MRTLLMIIGILLVLSLSSICYGRVEVKLFDSGFIRGIGAPVPKLLSFPGLSGAATVEVYNGSLENASVEKVSSSTIKINGNVVFGPSNLNQNVSVLQKEIVLNNGSNTIEVVLQGKPGGTLNVVIKQQVDAEGASVVGPNGGELNVNDVSSPLYGTKCLIPVNALSEDIVMFVKEAESSPNFIDDDNGIGKSVDFGPTGTSFLKPVTIILPFMINDIADAHILSKKSLSIYNYDDKLQVWKPIETYIDENSNQVSADIYHYSTYKINGDKLKPVNTGASTDSAIVFVHGLQLQSLSGFGNYTSFGNMPNFLSTSYDVYSFNYDSFRDIEKTAINLKDALNSIKSSTGKNIIIIAHSEGGLVTRRYLQDTKYGHDVSTVFLLGTPNHGSIFSNVYSVFKPISMTQMIPGSQLLNSLNNYCTADIIGIPSDVNIYNIYNDDIKIINNAFIENGDGIVSADSATISEYPSLINNIRLSKSLAHTRIPGILGPNFIADIEKTETYPSCDNKDTCNHPVWNIIKEMLANPSSNQPTWAKTYGTNLNTDDKIYSIAMTENDGCLLSGYTYDKSQTGLDVLQIWILKLDANGSIIWQKTFGTGVANKIHKTRDGSYVVAGSLSPWGASSIFVLKIDSDGNVQWKNSYGPSSDHMSNSNPTAMSYEIKQTLDDGFIIVDSCYSGNILKLDKDGNIQWKRTFPASQSIESIVETPGGGYIASGYASYSYGSGGWIAKINNDGSLVWEKSYSMQECDFYSIISSNDGNYYAAGYGNSSNGNGYLKSAAWILKIDNNGNPIWQKIYQSGVSTYIKNAKASNDGGLIVAGGIHKADVANENNINADGLILKIDANGNIVWTKSYGRNWQNDFRRDMAYSIEKTAGNGYLVAISNGFSYGGDNTPALIIKMNNDGDILKPNTLLGEPTVTVSDTNAIIDNINIDSYLSYPVINSIATMPKNTNASMIKLY